MIIFNVMISDTSINPLTVDANAHNKESKPKGIFLNVDEIEQALENKFISLHSNIISTFETVDEKGNKKNSNLRV